MVLREFGLVILIVVFLATVVGSQAHKFSKTEHWTKDPAFQGHDAIVEETAEEVLEVLGQGHQDLTPESPEKQ